MCEGSCYLKLEIEQRQFNSSPLSRWVEQHLLIQSRKCVCGGGGKAEFLVAVCVPWPSSRDGAGWCAEIPSVGGAGERELNKGESWGPFTQCARVALWVLFLPCASHLRSKRSKERGVWMCVRVGGGEKLQIYKSWSSHKQL